MKSKKKEHRSPRVIRRYENKKYYDHESRLYLTMSDVGELVEHGYAVEVVDDRTGDDLTDVTLARVLYDLLRTKKVSAFPRIDLVRMVAAASRAVEAEESS